MRRRVIDPNFWADSKITSLTFPARLLYIGLWQYADDEGLFVVDLKNIKMVLFPDQEFALEKCWQELTQGKFFRFGSMDGQQIAEIRHFKSHQTINRPTPSKLKSKISFTEDSLNPHAILSEDSLLSKEKRSKEKSNGSSCMSPQGKFEIFYKAYPKKRGRKDALKAFLKLNPDDAGFAEMMRALEAWKKTDEWQKERGKYVCQPATWLNGERWKDELPTDNNILQTRPELPL